MRPTVQTILCALSLIVYTRSFSSAQSGCYGDSPDSCQFTCGGFCHWTNESGWVSERSDRWFISLSQATGRLRSRLACASGGAEHCLTFWYSFSENFVYDLNVLFIKSGSEEVKAWSNDHSIKASTTGGGGGDWSRASVTLNATEDFEVVIEGVKYRGDIQGSSVSVDSLEYTTSPCGIDQSAQAQLPVDPDENKACLTTTPASSAATSATGVTDTIVTVTDKTAGQSDTTSSNAHQTMFSSPVLKSSLAPGNTPRSNNAKTDATGDEAKDEEGSSGVDGGIIAAVVVVVILIIVIAVGAVIFAFRKKLWA